jgi:ATP-dependent RNA helicase DeaD
MFLARSAGKVESPFSRVGLERQWRRPIAGRRRVLAIAVSKSFISLYMESTIPTPSEATTPPPPEITSFDQLDLSPVMRRSLQRLGYETPSPIQAQVIPPALDGQDIFGQARTGTGKTAAFSIPIRELLDPLSECHNPQALVLVPTRELAEQVYLEMERLAYGCKTAISVLAGGKHMRKQMQQLKDGTQIVVGTPGRVMDHIQRRTFRTDDLWCIVLDEADRMLDIGFRPAIEKILRACPKDRQTMLLSATLAPDIERLSKRYMEDPVFINCSSTQVSVETIEQRYFSVRQEEKIDTLVRLLEREEPRQAIIFCRTKRGTDRLHRTLQTELAKIDSLAEAKLACIHGDMNQRDRDRVFNDLRSGKINILVATDVVGRGIDVSTVSHIINFDMPLDCDDYVHRVGRTGRMGREGIAFTFVTAAEGPQLTAIELNINRLLARDSLDPEAEAAAQAEAAPPPAAEAAEPEPPRKKRLFPMKRKASGRLARVGAKGR